MASHRAVLQYPGVHALGEQRRPYAAGDLAGCAPALARAELVDSRPGAAPELAVHALLESALLEQTLQGGDFGALRTDLERGVLRERHLDAAQFRFRRGDSALADIEKVLVDIDRHAGMGHIDAIVVLMDSLVIRPAGIAEILPAIGVRLLIGPGDPQVIGQG